MIFFLNRGLILEQEIVKAVKKYFSIIDIQGYYENYTVGVTNEHPFARMLLSESPEKDAASLFPVVVVTTAEDSKPGELSNLTDCDHLTIEPGDIAEKEGGGPSAIEERYEMITPKKISELRAAMKARTDKRIFGTSYFIRRRDHITIEIWAENPQLKNELYEAVRLFVCGFMKDYLAQQYREYFKELGEGESPLVIFDSSVRGQRSNNFNVEFGIELTAGAVTFDTDYVIEQTVIDTEIVDTKNLLLEVINHVKGYIDTARERIAIGDAGKPGRTAGDGAAESGGGQPAEPGGGKAAGNEAAG